MIKRLIQGTAVSSLVVILPVLGNAEVLRLPQVWFLVAIGVLASVLQPDYGALTIVAKPGDKGTGAQIVWSVYFTQLAAILEATYLRYPQSFEWATIASAALAAMVLGLALRTWAVVALGRFFTMHISVQKGHAIVRDGPYKIVRHPSYLGAFVLYTSTTVFLHAWFSAAAATVILSFAFLRRMRREEQVLRKELGASYESYCAEVCRILPGLW